MAPRLLRDPQEGRRMAKRQDDTNPPQRDTEDIRGIASDEEDDFDADDEDEDMDESEDDEDAGL